MDTQNFVSMRRWILKTSYPTIHFVGCSKLRISDTTFFGMREKAYPDITICRIRILSVMISSHWISSCQLRSAQIAPRPARRRGGGGGALCTVMIGSHWVSSGQPRSVSSSGQLRSTSGQAHVSCGQLRSRRARRGGTAGACYALAMHCNDWITLDQLRSSSG